MMKMPVALLFLFLLAEPLFGREYLIRYQNLTSGSIFHVETKEGIKVGKIIRELNGMTLHYSYLSPQEQLLAKGKIEKTEIDTNMHLHDDERSIGSFAADIRNVYPTDYRIFSPDNALVAKGVMNWLCTSFTLADPRNCKRHIATFFRPMFKLFNDNWHFEIHEEGIIDFRLLAIIGVFQTAFDLKFEKLEKDIHF